MRLPLTRSFLFAPGDRDRILQKAFGAGADAVILDLEESVAPSHKDEARDKVITAVDTYSRKGGPWVWIRTNDPRSPYWRDDLETLSDKVAGVWVAKLDAIEELDVVSTALAEVEQRKGLEPNSVMIVGMVESAAGLLACEAVARHPRVVQLALGERDFCGDINANSYIPEATLWARSKMVVASRAAGIASPTVPTYVRFKDEDGWRERLHLGKALGCFGAACIHPVQLDPVHEAFNPRPDQIALAKKVKKLFEDSDGGGFATEDGLFVDAAVARWAYSILDLTHRLGIELPEDGTS